MFQRITALALVLGVFAAGAVAEAKVVKGNYRGKTVQQAKVSFRILNAKTVVRYSLEGAVMDCDDGENRQLEGFTTSSSDRIPLSKAGRFGFTIGNDEESVGVQVKGLAKGKRARGTIRMVATFNDQDELDPNGGVNCDSGSVRWTAKRR